ncbi:MAG TPA: serpin family protein [Polyangiaceae bacterium]|nr:serpin family protein [Polyangiaceae bacterium]
MNDDTKPTATMRTATEQISARALGNAVKANNEFGTALFAALREESAGQNFLTSPISASLALGMTYAGASGETRTQMAHALRLAPSADGDPSFFEGQNALSQALAQRGTSAFEMEQANRGKYGPPLNASDYSLRLVNSLWGEASYPWQASFTKALAVNYGAELCRRDFKHQSQPTRLEVNRWVSAHTNDRINDLLPEPAVTANTRLLLVNALHLKLPWEDEFFEGATKPLPFTRSDRKQMMAPFMHRQQRLAYRDDGSAQIVGIPLASRRLWVIIALPHVGVSLADYERSLRADSAALTVPLQSELVALALPKVTFTSPSFSLASALQRMGMVHAFDPNRAQFEGMCQVQPGEVPLYVGDVLQKTMIAMQESGIEAAAATAVVAIAGCAALPREQPVPIPMIVNRPYLLAIVDQPTSALLMLGHIEEPTA